MNSSSAVPAYPPGFWVAVFLPFATAYLLSFALRSVNAAIAPQLTAEFALDAATLGLLTSAYFLAFAFTQLPLGAWLDRFRPRRVNAALLVLCATGCLIFATASSSSGLVLGRLLIGMGVAACLMASLRTFGLWLAPAQLPTTNGLMLAVGNAGAILSTAPVVWLLGYITWSQLFIALAVAACLASLWLSLKVPDPPALQHTAPEISGTSSWRMVLGHRLFWIVVPMASLTNAVGLAVQGLWTGPWLIDVAGLPAKQIGPYLLLVPAGMLVANVLLGKALTIWVQRGGSAIHVAALAPALALLGQLPFLLSWTYSPALVMLVFGLTHVCGNLAFAALAPQFPASVAGRLVTTINFLMFGTSFLLQWSMGIVINQFPAAVQGRYLAEGYETAFLLLGLVQVVVLIWTLAALRRLNRAVRPI